MFWYSLALGKGALCASFLAHLKQSIVLWAPFLSAGQAHLWHSPAAFLLSNSDFSIFSVCSAYVLLELFFILKHLPHWAFLLSFRSWKIHFNFVGLSNQGSFLNRVFSNDSFCTSEIGFLCTKFFFASSHFCVVLPALVIIQMISSSVFPVRSAVCCGSKISCRNRSSII